MFEHIPNVSFGRPVNDLKEKVCSHFKHIYYKSYLALYDLFPSEHQS